MDRVNQKMKKFNLRGVLDGLRSSVSTPPKSEIDIEENLRSDHFQVAKTVRHGFPYQPTAMAYDPVQNLLAIGTNTGSLRIFGRPGVDCHVKHEGDVSVIQVLFLINEGAMVTACTDDHLHLWTLRQKNPYIVHSLKFTRERITYCSLPFQSKWLYVGTERGNVHIVNIESFQLSGYVINWNKAIELTRKTHPGPVVHLSDNPMDPGKLLIGFESGIIVLWDLKTKAAEFRYSCTEALKSVCWHHEGKMFMCSHADGSLTTWNVRAPQKPQSILMPHAKLGKDGKPEPCQPITKVEWCSCRTGEPYMIFSGGMPYDKATRTPCLTVMHGKSTTVLEMEHNVIDFLPLNSTPWSNDFQDPYAIVVLLQNDLVVVDLTTPGYPCFENPYPMDIHESPVTACKYVADCPPDLIPAFYSVGSKQKKTGFSEKEWPVKGGEWGTTTCSYPEIIITGHADGSLKFWDASAVTLQVLYKLKTAKVFDKNKCRNPDPDDDPFAIQHIHLCGDSRLLCVAGINHVILFKFSRTEQQVECPALEIAIVYEIYDDLDSPELEYPPCPVNKPSISNMSQQSGSVGSYSSTTSDGHKESQTCVKVKAGGRKWSPGYQPDLCCILQWFDGDPPPNITSVSVNSRYGLLGFGNECGLAIVDIVQKTTLLNMGTPDLYGSMDPYVRAPRSPKTKSQLRPDGTTVDTLSARSFQTEDAKSPTTDQPPSKSSTATLNSIHQSSPASPRKMADDIVGHHASTSHSSADEVRSSVHRQMSQLSEPTIEEAEEALDYDLQEKELLKQPLDSENLAESCNSLVEALAAATTANIEEQSKQDEASEGKGESENDHGTPVRPPRRRSSALNKLHKNSKDDENTDGSNCKDSDGVDGGGNMDEVNVNKPCLRQTVSYNPTPADQQVVTMTVAELQRGYRSESDLVLNTNASNKLVINTGDMDECQTDGVHREPPQSAPPVPTKHRKDSLSFVRKMSRKIRTTMGGSSANKESAALEACGNSSEDDTLDKPERISRHDRSSSRKGELPKLCLKPKFELIDLTMEDVPFCPPIRKCHYVQHALMDKTDGSFSRSRSSSMSSLENISKEAIQCLVFTDAYTRKSDASTVPCLWVGTSLGSVLVINLSIPSDECRMDDPVIVSPSGTIFRLKGAILTMSFLDCKGILLPAVADAWQENDNRMAQNKKQYNRQQSMSSMRAYGSPTTTEPQQTIDRQFAIMCSEKQARVMSLPSQTCAYKVKITETSIVTVADVISIRDSVALACYVANGHIVTFSLPSLRPLLDVDYLPLTDVRIAKTFCFSSNGHCVYFCSPTELQKITLSADISDRLTDMLGELFLPCDTPEAPKKSFLQNLFSGGSNNFDREELFGETSGKANKGVAKYSAGTAGMTQAQERAGAACSEIGRAKMLALERGEKLGQADEATEHMKVEAEEYARQAHSVMLKYKNKKWYQF